MRVRGRVGEKVPCLVIGPATVGIKVGDLVKTGNNDLTEGFDNQTRQVKSVHTHPAADHDRVNVQNFFEKRKNVMVPGSTKVVILELSSYRL